MKIALVGIGYWGSKLLRNLVRLIGVENAVAVDTNAEFLKNAYETYPGLDTHLSLDDALADPAVEGVIIATAMSSHHKLAMQALESGRHVMVEKPLAASVVEATEIATFAEQQNRVLMVGHTFLFSPRVEMLSKLIAQGEVGALHYLTSSRLNLGLFRADTNVIWDLGPHDLSILFHLVGEYPMRVQTAARSLIPDGNADVAFLNLWFASGVIASINISWMSPRKERRVVIVGDKGMIYFDDADAEEPIKIFDKGVDRAEGDDFGSHQLTYRHGNTVAPFVDADEPLYQELASFKDRIEARDSTLSDGWFGVEIVKCLEAADTSQRLGGMPVEIERSPSEHPGGTAAATAGG